MKISEFFQSQSPQHLNHAQKSTLYTDFLRKRERRSSSMRWGLVSKRFMTYSVLSVIALGSFFGSDWITSLFFTIDKPQVLQVSAQNIGTIVESQGKLTITNNGRIITSSSIQLNDQIVLADHASVKILINDSFQADIVGPATFEIVPTSKVDDRIIYNLKFTHGGDYIAIDTPNDTINNEIAVQTTQGVVIKNAAIAKKSSFTIVNSSSEKNTTILNKSSTSLEVTKIGNQDDVKQATPLTIDPVKIVELDTTPSSDTSLQILTTEDLTKEKEQHIVIVHAGTSTTPLTPIIESKKSLLTASPVDEMIDDTILAKERTKKELYTIEQNLYATFLQNDMRDILTYHLLGNENAAQISYHNLSLRMERILNIMGKDEKRKAQTIQDLIDTVILTQTTIQSEYDANLSKINYNLKTVLARLQLLKEYKFGVYKHIANLSGSIEQLSFDDLLRMTGISTDMRTYKFR